MNWTKFLTYGDSPQNAFETLCNQLFERFLKRTYFSSLIKYRVINGAGGDGGIEAYGELLSGEIIALQAKWFRQNLDNSEIEQIKNSILTAKRLRPQIKKYFICIPHNVNSLKIGRGNKPTKNHEENKINDLINKIFIAYSDLELVWWFDNELLIELQQNDNEGVNKYWFDREIISKSYLSKLFNLQKKGWLKERYIAELHGQGLIHKEYQKICFAIEYRKELLKVIEEVTADLNFCYSLIEKFIPTNQSNPEINEKLNNLKNNLSLFYTEIKNIANAVNTGNDSYKPARIGEIDLWKIYLELKKLTPHNTQKNILPKLISSLEKVHQSDLPQFIEHLNFDFRHSIRLILGEPGTGKTHGLANCVELHLANNSPAIIIQAKGSPSNNWTEILSKAFQLIDWRMDEILSALETLAIRNDNKLAALLKAGEESTQENTKALICIDGLEEDIKCSKEWYARIRECEQLANEYPRIRFIFSARRYFFDNTEVPQRGIYDDVFLPREGDVSILKVAPKYFSKEYYNIQLPSLSLIRSIDSLFALRLFCDKYKNKNLTGTEKIVTATRDLINQKIEKSNQEFSSYLNRKISQARNPILDALELIANYFYLNHEIEHNKLVNLISPTVKYLDASEIDSLIDFFSNNGFLIMSIKISDDDVFNKTEYIYSITYQSIIEHIISESIYHKIRDGSLERIPEFLHREMIQPLEFNPKDSPYSLEIPPNKKIIQNIINNLFVETGKLIGENGFIIDGFDESEIKKFQLIAIANAPRDISIKYKTKINDLFHSGFKNLLYVLEYLILPSSYNANSAFGAEYLHTLLSKFPTPFERDKVWSGLDMFELREIPEIERYYFNPSLSVVFKEHGIGLPILSDFNLHNDLPLVFAWGLSTIDQELRNNLRISLTDWAIKNPSEYLLLLQKIFHCNDPQIQEDLGSIALGIASKLKDKQELKKLADWGIENIFRKLEQHRNIIVRHGFRALTERAYQLGAISIDEVEICRPKPSKNIMLLKLEQNLHYEGQGECYPIVHDLAWYVIKNAYDDFLELPYATGEQDRDCNEAKSLLDKYREVYNEKKIFASYWGMSAAIAYIKSLGFTRTEGNWHTQATHGIKSKIFTYEEKYTWLAVHYIQGYLSDYVPLKNWSGNREFIKDYSQITDIPNPADSIINIDLLGEKSSKNKEWVIKETLSRELEIVGDLKINITNWVNEEPKLDFEKWLSFCSEDFSLEESNRKWTAIYNYTALHDSKEFCNSIITCTACFVLKDDLFSFKKIVTNNPDSLYFIKNLNGLHASPRTAIYCSPIDLVWMNWIEEDQKDELCYDSYNKKEIRLIHSITELAQNRLDGENHMTLPSKFIRELLNCYEFIDGDLKDSSGKTLAFTFKISDSLDMDNQELVLIDTLALKNVLVDLGYEIVWFIDLFKQKNPLNEKLDKNFNIQKSRKYFVWREDKQKKNIKFWDELFSNERDMGI